MLSDEQLLSMAKNGRKDNKTFVFEGQKCYKLCRGPKLLKRSPGAPPGENKTTQKYFVTHTAKTLRKTHNTLFEHTWWRARDPIEPVSIT
jgi:hypothetical protein